MAVTRAGAQRRPKGVTATTADDGARAADGTRAPSEGVTAAERAMVDDRGRAGSATGWRAIYEAHAPHLVQLATFLVGPDDARDLVADGVARAVRSEAWAGVRDHRAYLTRVLVNAASDERRRRARREGRERRATMLDPRGLYVAGTPDVDVRAALSGLSPQQRAIVFLTYWEDLTIPAVARRLDITEGSVRRQLARAKDRLRRALHDAAR